MKPVAVYMGMNALVSQIFMTINVSVYNGRLVIVLCVKRNHFIGKFEISCFAIQ